MASIDCLAASGEALVEESTTHLRLGDDRAARGDVPVANIPTPIGTSGTYCAPLSPSTPVHDEPLLRAYKAGFDAAVAAFGNHRFSNAPVVSGKNQIPATTTLPRLVYSVREVSQMLNVSQKTVYRLVHRGLLKTDEKLRHLRITATSIQKFIAAGSEPAMAKKTTS